MKQSEIEVGGSYEIRHSGGEIVTVKVLRTAHRAHKSRTIGCTQQVVGGHTGYVCLKEKTGREIIVKHASKFRRRVEHV